MPGPTKVVILCGGQGTRLREETEFRPKPLVPIGERPVLWHIMKIFSCAGLHDFVLCLGYRGNMIKEYFLNYEAMNNDFTICLGRQRAMEFHNEHHEQDFRVTLVDTGQDVMTGGRIRRIRDYVGDSDFMVAYGDTLADIDVAAVLRFHQAHGKVATISAVRPVSRFGLLEVEGERVARFSEKPQTDGWINAGFMVFRQDIFNYLPGDDCVLELDPMERLAGEGQLMAYRHEGCFFAMDTFREFRMLNDMWTSGQAPWKIWT